MKLLTAPVSTTKMLVLLALTAGLGGCAARTAPRSATANAAAEQQERRRTAAEFVERAIFFARIGDVNRAEQYLNAALERGADENRVFPVLLRVCIKDGRYRAAAGYAENYLRRHPQNHSLRFVLATLYVGLGDSPKARQQFERVIAAVPEHAHAHYAYAVLLRDYDGDYDRADRHFREYLRLSPGGAHSEEATGSLLQRIP
jgi:tetratricopeptide (TPR) repeat protein